MAGTLIFVQNTAAGGWSVNSSIKADETISADEPRATALPRIESALTAGKTVVVDNASLKADCIDIASRVGAKVTVSINVTFTIAE